MLNLDIIFIANFEHISHLVLVFLLLTLSKQMPAGKIYKIHCIIPEEHEEQLNHTLKY